ncbi:hypothetical protein GCM10007874_34590 [Labrys miyagiensis]|uniref:Uncharacterized protein n=1 Tax=Labrys miyagiensis TaxID=346912 RepID=A0ABQ6CQD5_9HYPH|nr:hypothetical protein [Labrys miyagiensis]GLS20442.1 hypothetical protein GCM10007874_34590 [Labrys miyagiensis]
MRRIMSGIVFGLLGPAFVTVAMAQDAQKPSGPTLEDLQKTIQAQSAQIAALQQSVNALAAAGKAPKSLLIVNGYPKTFDIDHSALMRGTTRRDAGDICHNRLGTGAFATGLEQVSPTQVIFTCEVPETP